MHWIHLVFLQPSMAGPRQLLLFCGSKLGSRGRSFVAFTRRAAASFGVGRHPGNQPTITQTALGAGSLSQLVEIPRSESSGLTLASPVG